MNWHGQHENVIFSTQKKLGGEREPNNTINLSRRSEIIGPARHCCHFLLHRSHLSTSLQQRPREQARMLFASPVPRFSIHHFSLFHDDDEISYARYGTEDHRRYLDIHLLRDATESIVRSPERFSFAATK